MKDHDYSELEALLSNAKPEADQNFRLLLRHQILNNVEVSQHSSRERFAFWGQLRLWQPVVGVSLLLFLFFALTPTGRGWAQQLLELGIFYVTDDPTLAEQFIDAPQLEEESILLESIKTSIVEASAQAGFAVYYPTYIPAEYESDTPPLEVVFSSDGMPEHIGARFTHVSDDMSINYFQHPFPPDETLDSMPLAAGDATVEAVTVNGNEALWLVDYVWGTTYVKDVNGEPQELKPIFYNLLIWTAPNPDGGKFYFWLGSEAQLPFEEMIKIAESMTTE